MGSSMALQISVMSTQRWRLLKYTQDGYAFEGHLCPITGTPLSLALPDLASHLWGSQRHCKCRMAYVKIRNLVPDHRGIGLKPG